MKLAHRKNNQIYVNEQEIDTIDNCENYQLVSLSSVEITDFGLDPETCCFGQENIFSVKQIKERQNEIKLSTLVVFRIIDFVDDMKKNNINLMQLQGAVNCLHTGRRMSKRQELACEFMSQNANTQKTNSIYYGFVLKNWNDISMIF